MDSKKNVGIFIDVSNIYYCVSKKFPERKLNYKAYLDKVTEGFDLYCAHAYGTLLNDKVLGFTTALKHIGFVPNFRKGKIIQDNKMLKVEWGVGIAMQVVRTIEKLDVVILGSASAEHVPLVEWIKERGIQVVIVACGINKELKERADRFVEIDESFLETHTLGLDTDVNQSPGEANT